MNRKIAWILIIVGIVAISIFSGCLFDKAKVSFQEGQELLQKGEYEDAIAKYKSVVTNYSDSLYASKAKDAIPECFYKWGLQLQENKQYDAAMEKYQTLFNQYPNSSFASLAKKALYEFPYGIGDTVVGEDWKIKVLSVDRKDIIARGFSYKPVRPSKEGEVLLCVKINLESLSEITEKTYLNYESFLKNTTDFPITNDGGEYTPIGATKAGSFAIFPVTQEWWSQGKIIVNETIVYSVPKEVKGYKLKFKDFPSINLEQKGIFSQIDSNTFGMET